MATIEMRLENAARRVREDADAYHEQVNAHIEQLAEERRRLIAVAECQKQEDDRNGNRDPNQPPLHLCAALCGVFRADIFWLVGRHRV